MAAPVTVPIDQRFAQLIQQFGLTKNSFAMSLGKTASVPEPAAPAPASIAAPVPGPETYMAAALHAQHLQHQLAMAEMRNQHLLEQQQMLREMLAMARQAMV
jgi:hypothetical protein